MANYDATYFTEYKEQTFRWDFWRKFLKRSKAKEPFLEVGCAYGHLSRRMSEWSEKEGIDISTYAIEEAGKRDKTTKYTVMDVENLRYKEETWNTITCFDVIEHLDNPEKALTDMHRILKKDGLLIITTPNTSSLSKRLRKKNWFAFKDRTHIALKSPKEWTAICKGIGFKIEKSVTMDTFDVPPRKIGAGLNLVLYKAQHPFIPKIGDNTVFVLRK